MRGRATVEIRESPELVAARGAELFLSAARDDISARGRFTVALSGGATPAPLFRMISREAPGAGMDWSRTHIFWVDERCVPPDHQDSNFRLAHELLLAKVPPPGPVLHRIRGELPPQEAARAYEIDLARTFAGIRLPDFDLIWLGLGADGHTASLFPGADPERSPDRTAIPVRTGHPGSRRVTLTLPVINNARRVVMLVTGAGKADIVAEILAGKGEERFPAALVAPSEGTLTWLLDREAAGGLEDIRGGGY